MKRTAEANLPLLERRRTGPIEAPDTLRVEILTSTIPIHLINLGREGFLLSSVVPFETGARHRFRFKTSDWDSGVLKAVAVHCTHDGIDPSSFVTGFAFVDVTDETAELENRVTSALTYL